MNNSEVRSINLLIVTDANGNTTAIHAYDNQDRLETRTDPLGNIERYEYDLNGNLTKFTDRKGQVSNFTYDALDRRVLAGYADGSTTTFRYDPAGNLVEVQDSASGTIEMTYDNLNRLISEVTPQGVVNYTYDILGRRESMAYNGLQAVGYNYDDASRLTQVTQSPTIVNLGYDDAGRRTSLTYPNGTNTAYTYDDASRVTEILHDGPSGVIEDLFYTYDSAGNRISFNREQPQADLPAAITAAQNEANQLTQFNTDTLTYDLNGNLTSDGTSTYTWDARNRLVQLNSASLSAEFKYDALGRRVGKTINGNTTYYLYDGNDIVGEIQGGTITATYLRSLNIDEPFVRSSDIEEYYHADALGSVMALSDGVGMTQTAYSYDPFGITTVAGVSDNPFQYTGRENDGTGLYNYRARYYGNRLGRFVSEDPIRYLGGDINLYGYVHNNPIAYFDPWGLAQFGRRPLDCLLCPGLYPFNPPLDDPPNLERSHEQLFFEDESSPSNLGFFSDGVRPDDPGNLGQYEMFGPHFDDDLMRRIIEEDDPGNYCIVGNNCHDWADRIRKEYERRANTPACFIGGRKPPEGALCR